MSRFAGCLLSLGCMLGCAHVPQTAQQDCHLESGWLDSTNGCSVREGYPSCYRVCADGTRVLVGGNGAPRP